MSDTEVFDILPYDNRSILDSTSKMVQKVWMNLTSERRRAFSGYGVFLSQDCSRISVKLFELDETLRSIGGDVEGVPGHIMNYRLKSTECIIQCPNHEICC